MIDLEEVCGSMRALLTMVDRVSASELAGNGEEIERCRKAYLELSGAIQKSDNEAPYFKFNGGRISAVTVAMLLLSLEDVEALKLEVTADGKGLVCKSKGTNKVYWIVRPGSVEIKG